MNLKTEVGSLLVIRRDGGLARLIAEVTKADPLTAKVTESGPDSKLKADKHFLILESETRMIQGTEEQQEKLLFEAAEKGFPLRSGLKSLKADKGDGRMYDILPVPVEVEA